MLRPRMMKRDFSGFVEIPQIRYVVNSLDWEARGGCKAASITAYGDELGLWRLLETLRCGLEIRDEWGEACWWGMVGEARVRVDALEVGATIDSMTNAVAVAYSYVTPGSQAVGERKTTAWTTDSVSIAEYGQKEFLSSMDGLSDAAALARRDAILAARKWPQGIMGQFGGPRGRVRYSRAKKSLSATIYGRGWGDSLRWRYASVASVTGPNYSNTTSTEQNVGSSSSNTKVMQQALVGSQAINVLQVEVYGRKQGSPTDNLVLELYELEGGAPAGSALGSVSIAGSGLGTSLGWITGTLSSETQLQAGRLYGLQASRSGAANGSDYYVVNVNTGLGYTSGAFKIWNGSAWVARSPDADMPFRLQVNNDVETTEQVRDLAMTYGAFITGVDVDEGSGVILPSYRDGDTDALQEILTLLECGGANGRRLLYEIDVNRRMHVFEEPDSSPILYHLDSDGRLTGQYGLEVKEYQPPVGEWLHLRDVIPANVDVSKLISPELQFIEAANWSAEQGLKLAFRGQPSIEEMFKVRK